MIGMKSLPVACGTLIVGALLSFITLNIEWSNITHLAALSPVIRGAHHEHPSHKGRRLIVVTAYLNIGTFNKGSSANQRNVNTYREWIRVFANLDNPVVAYFDEKAMADYFSSLRRNLPTKTVVIKKTNLWSFSLLRKTRYIFEQPDYPKNEPKSTNAPYVCTMHAKFELLNMSIERDYFDSEYFAWLDVGLFRTLVENGDTTHFSLTAPLCHNPDASAYSQVYGRSDTSVEQIMRDGIDWVSDAFALATKHTMLAFCADYKKHVLKFLDQNLANADQAVIHSMYSSHNADRPVVPMQAFIPDGTFDPWFYLAFAMRESWLKDETEGSSGVLHRRCTFDAYF